MTSRDDLVDLCLAVAEIPHVVAEVGLAAALRADRVDDGLVILADRLERAATRTVEEPFEIPPREFPTLALWRRTESERAEAPAQNTVLVRLRIGGRDDVLETCDPVRTAACYEQEAREWYGRARHADTRHCAKVCLATCDELLARSAAVLAATDADPVEEGSREPSSVAPSAQAASRVIPFPHARRAKTRVRQFEHAQPSAQGGGA